MKALLVTPISFLIRKLTQPLFSGQLGLVFAPSSRIEDGLIVHRMGPWKARLILGAVWAQEPNDRQKPKSWTSDANTGAK